MWELKRELDTRKENLMFLLKNKKDFLEIEKQHQLYGAIKELDHVISLIENQRDEQQIENTEQATIVLNTNEGEQEIKATKVSEKTKKFKIPISFKFSNKNE